MSFVTTNRKGNKVVLLNPAEKAAKYADELRNGIRYTNDNRYKVDKDGVVLGLDKAQRAYRSSYLDARKDSANCYKYKQKKR